MQYGILVSSEIRRAGIGAGDSEDRLEVVVAALERWENGRAVDRGQKCIGASRGEIWRKGGVSEYGEGGRGGGSEGKQETEKEEGMNLGKRARAVVPMGGSEPHDAMEQPLT